MVITGIVMLNAITVEEKVILLKIAERVSKIIITIRIMGIEIMDKIITPIL